MTTHTRTITTTEAARAYDTTAPFLVVATWTDAHGEQRDLLMGAGETEDEARAEYDRAVDLAALDMSGAVVELVAVTHD